ncbi:uncharacterized protein CTHT_0068440 [Thermochaetoides thermophila DSM 1495]|uniref:Uncharacterized protein n=1 Tax=Chaetomium thermophilum (strain DSM 1495 / CBS 144.50 / IMI 039719) TaxID=759272 RepID=G0SH25_CHATD|nr:hypothetical protein CTHT_0068440 [Thermochaetoides thermophila DSM 1495]EGS17514.1 hypothetical protein CTHT_0068440 [Thermochaetoides thermophila DSM 1495]
MPDVVAKVALIQPYKHSPATNVWNRSAPPAPLVLVHDGGGTTFCYHFLGYLGRPVYGIDNPHYDSGKAWEGGIPEMAREYLKPSKV